MDLGRTLVDLLVVLVASRVAAEAAERLRQPAVLAEILIGVALGPSVIGAVHGGEALQLLGEIGVILLLFEVGREMDPRELMRVGGASLRVAVIGVVAPMALGFAAMRAIGIDTPVALFLAGAITATSVGITARVFGDLRALSTGEARTVLGAAVVDDVIGLLVLAVVTRAAAGGGVDAGAVFGLLATALGFVLGAAIIGTLVVPHLLDRVVHRARTDGTLMALGLAVALGFARLASAARLAPIVGAFVAGLAVGRSRAAEDLHRRLVPLGHFFIPIFFVQIGIDTDLGVFTDPGVLGIAALLTAVAVVGKLVSGLGVGRGRGDRLLVGVGMMPRGEVGLIFASLGRAGGILDARAYGVLVVVVMATTLAAPPWMRRRIQQSRTAVRTRSHEVIEPPRGWLLVGDEVELAATPPDALAGLLGLRAAAACATMRPGPRLVEWLSALDAPPVAWDEETRRAFFSLLREANPRSWRFLEMTGLLERLLPALGEALARRPVDPFDLDPAGAHRFPVLEDLRRLLDEDPEAAAAWKGIDQDLVRLAAFARDVLANEPDPGPSARALASALGLDAARAAALELLVSERHLLPAAAARPEAMAEERILELAAHIGAPALAAGLYVLALAENAMEPWERERLDALYGLLLDVLAQPDLTGRSATDLLDRRYGELSRMLPRMSGKDLRDHLWAAPRRSVLTQPTETIARHIRMMQTRPGPSEVRLEAEPSDRGWTLHVVFADRHGGLAAIAGALVAQGVSVGDAQISTWRNGIAVDVFGVQAPLDTDWEAVRRSMHGALNDAGAAGVAPEVAGELLVDNLASPWHSIVEIRTEDREGLLYRVASAMTAAGIQIHQASVTTRDGRAVDTFWVTGSNGGKLDQAAEERLRAALAGRRAPAWRARWRRTRGTMHRGADDVARPSSQNRNLTAT